MKTLQTLHFCDGMLSIKMTGHGEADGWGELVFDENQIELRPKEERSGNYAVIEIAPSELAELRDWLNKTLPAPASATGRADG